MKKKTLLVVLISCFLTVAYSNVTEAKAEQNQAQNSVQAQTANQGEEAQVQTQTQATSAELNTAAESVGKAALQAGALIQYQFEGENESLGNRIKSKAQEQVQAHQEIQQQLDNLDARKGVARWLAGPDYKAIQELETLKEQNQLRIQQLNSFKLETQNQAEESMLQNTMQAIEQENTALQEKIETEGQTKSLFGWMFRFFAKYF
ncbi:hypothetical protein KKB83_02925 [Patescibacteria group bacterium]|nr:hypothetical protein [Patescibacteria group bacterium]